jgi:uncharacterized membrane protein
METAHSSKHRARGLRGVHDGDACRLLHDARSGGMMRSRAVECVRWIFYKDAAVFDAVRQFIRFRMHLIAAIICGTIIALALPGSLKADVRVLLGWNIGLWLYLAMIWTMMIKMRPQQVQEFAAREDENAATVLIVVCVAAVASIAAIVLELAHAKQGSAGSGAGHFLLAGITVIGGWFLIPTVFTLHYARLFYTTRQAAPALVFPDPGVKPDYWDFLYFSFTIAVASQTADIGLASRSMRRVALAQSILAFFFNASILALAINIAAGLV